MDFQPYLFFGGNCAEAFARYHDIFGGELFVMRMGDAPDAGDVPAEQADMVIHAALRFEDGALLMGSDDPMNPDFGPVQGMMVSYAAADADDARRAFDALVDKGTVNQALTQTFFSPAFGMCTDRFGTPWMVSAPDPNATA
jgi:PhnB protein